MYKSIVKGFTYTINTNTVGSAGTETNGFQLLKGSAVVMKNGTLNAGTSAKILVQKYNDLTLEDMNLVGGPQTTYVLSNNNGTTTLKGNTNITAAEGQVAFDCYYWPSNTYGDNYVVTENLTGKITGKLEFSHDNTVDDADAAQHAGIKVNSGTFSEPIEGRFCADGFIPEENADGTYGVKAGSYVAQVGETKYETLEEAVAAARAGETVKLFADVTLNNGSPSDSRYNLFINKDLTVDGQGHTITNGLERGIGVQAQNVTFKDVTINNANHNGRGIDTRGNIGTFTLDGVTINTTGSGNCQPFTIGGYQESNANVVVKNSTLNAGDSGYCVLMFNPVNMDITGSTLDGWGILYFKGPSGSTGANNSNINVTGSHIISRNANSGISNSFGAVVYENVSGNNVTINDCEV